MPAPRSPHDEFFKAVFSDVGHARDFLQGILPPEVTQQLALDELTPEPASFISEVLKESFSDLLFSCPLHGSRAMVAILLEHKTWQPAYPHLQILRYMVSIWEQNLSDKVPLQVVIPVVIHQGTVPWKAAPFLASFPDLPEDLRIFIPEIRMVLEDLAQTTDATLRISFQDPFVQTALAVMKHIYSPEGTLAVARSLNPELGGLQKEDALRSLHILLEYILRSGDTTLKDALIESIHPNLKGETMTIADTLRLEGKAQGIAEGKVEGKIEGIEEAKREDAHKMLARGCTWDFITDITGLTKADLDKN